MRYVITDKYANGDDYGEAFTGLPDLAYALGDIHRWNGDERIAADQRVIESTIKIETEV